ncbi:MAG TPA: oxidoreductase, partial [Gammaproteobacteria bacterium]
MRNAAKAYRALRVEQQGSGVAARIIESRLPPRTAAEILLEVRYSSINYKDALAILGRAKIMERLPLIAGID